MDFSSEFKKLNESWEQKRPGLSKDEIKHISDKDHADGLMLGIFSWKYLNRGKMISNSTLAYGYVFKAYQAEEEEAAKHYPVWVLFSPSDEVNSDPAILKTAAEKLRTAAEGKAANKDEKKLFAKVVEATAEADYVELPEAYTDGKLVYLSITYLRTNVMPDFKLGLNLLLIAPSVSKEVLFLPPEYWDDEWAEFYQNPIL
ncbi:MAG: hypothetical protein Q4F15_00945 [Bacillota bacterium]|nr:hypothetical protein [Bacillota bacterium]